MVGFSNSTMCRSSPLNILPTQQGFTHATAKLLSARYTQILAGDAMHEGAGVREVEREQNSPIAAGERVAHFVNLVMGDESLFLFPRRPGSAGGLATRSSRPNC